MTRISVRPARIVFGLLVAMLVTIVFAPSGHGQAPGPGAAIPIPAPVVPTLPPKAGQIGLTSLLFMLALFGIAAAQLSELKERRRAEQVHMREQNPRDAHAGAPAGNPRPHPPEGIPLEPRQSH